MARNKTVGYTPVGRRRRWIAVALGLAVVLALGSGAFVAGRATAPGATSASTTSGAPMPLRQGIPVPVRQTPAGAASAAQNFQIAGFRVAAGTLDAAAAADVLLASSASPAAAQVLAASTTPTGELAKTRSTFAPVSSVVLTYRPERAAVLVWGVAAASSQITPQPGGTEDWGSTTITLVWDGGQWRVADQRYESGPWPVRSDQRLASGQGDFGFRFSESGQGWSYVP